jgi:hypothetical protein
VVTTLACVSDPSRGWIIVEHGIEDRGGLVGSATSWLKVAVIFSTNAMMRARMACYASTAYLLLQHCRNKYHSR